MPPKSKKRKAVSAPKQPKEEGGEASVGQVPSEKQQNQPKLWFQWEGDRRKWTTYAWGPNQAIRDAHTNGKTKVTATVGEVEVEMKVDKMIQRNCSTKWERRIRCLVTDDEEYYVWQWQDERNKWNPYLLDTTLLLEEAYTGDKKAIDVHIGNQDYVIDVTKLEQRNSETDAVRKIERLKVDFSPPKEEPLPSLAADEASSTSVESTASGSQQARSGKKRVKKEENKDSKEKPAKVTKSAIKTVRLTGHAAPVDSECIQMQTKAHVFMEGKDIYDAMLNQTNLADNNNKYYLLQLLEDDVKRQYHVWFRWGRVGLKGQNNLTNCGSDLNKAKEMFVNKFWDKTKNEWSERKKFGKVSGKYDLLKMDYTAKINGEDEADVGKKKKSDKPKLESKIDTRIQNLIQLICNIQAMEDTVVEMKYDAQKAPLGKLTSQQIKAGYTALKKIEKCLENKDTGRTLVLACDEFYTRIPHNFGMQRPPIIRTRDEFKAKVTLLEALGDIQIAMKVLKAASNIDEHPIDRQYHALKCQLQPLEKSHEDFKMVETYLKNTHAKTHTQYTMQVIDLFEIEKEGEEAVFKDVGNRKLLWHGSRSTNWAGILGQGLRIAPPEAPVTGYMFGKGVYFADMSSKACNYCFATPSRNVGIVLLGEVTLGKTNDLLSADYEADQLPPGKDSVKGLGKIAPDEKDEITMNNGTVVPLGKGKNTGINNPNGYTLNYNEFIVYNTNQVRMRYLVKVKFNFK